MSLIPSCITALVLAWQAAPAADAPPFALTDGDRVVFYGDSITDQRLYTTFVEAYITTRFPHKNVTFVHSGWGGDRVTGGGGGPIDHRLKRDVIAYKPSVVTIMLGMNDASYRAFDQGVFDTYAKGYEHIVDSLKKELPGVRLTLIQPSPFDDVTRKPNFDGGYNNVLLKYGDYVKALAEKSGAGVADLNTGLTEATRKAEAVNHDQAVKFNPDRVHPGPAGQLLMAEGLLRAWNAPAVVSAVEIDARNAAAPGVNAQNAKVTELKVGPTVEWTQLDEALPFPLDLDDEVTRLALSSSDFLDRLDRQTLRVSGLGAARYELSIDGRAVGEFTREQLAEGINLATSKTPMWEQARAVLDLIRTHNDAHFIRWRNLSPNAFERFGAAFKDAQESIDRLEAEVVRSIRETSLPRPHRFTLTPHA